MTSLTNQKRYLLSVGDNPPYVTLGSAAGDIVISDDDGKENCLKHNSFISELCFIETPSTLCVWVEVGREPWLLASVCVEVSTL